MPTPPVCTTVISVVCFYYLHQGGYVIVVVRLSVCLLAINFAQKLPQRICIKFSGTVGSVPLDKWLHFGGDPNHCLDTGIVFRICHYQEIRKVVNGHSFILIRQMAALVRRALAEGTHCRSASSYGRPM